MSQTSLSDFLGKCRIQYWYEHLFAEMQYTPFIRGDGYHYVGKTYAPPHHPGTEEIFAAIPCKIHNQDKGLVAEVVGFLHDLIIPLKSDGFLIEECGPGWHDGDLIEFTIFAYRNTGGM